MYRTTRFLIKRCGFTPPYVRASSTWEEPAGAWAAKAGGVYPGVRDRTWKPYLWACSTRSGRRARFLACRVALVRASPWCVPSFGMLGTGRVGDAKRMLSGLSERVLEGGESLLVPGGVQRGRSGMATGTAAGPLRKTCRNRTWLFAVFQHGKSGP